jgi:hypothetical protein
MMTWPNSVKYIVPNHVSADDFVYIFADSPTLYRAWKQCITCFPEFKMLTFRFSVGCTVTNWGRDVYGPTRQDNTFIYFINVASQ